MIENTDCHGPYGPRNDREPHVIARERSDRGDPFSFLGDYGLPQPLRGFAMTGGDEGLRIATPVCALARNDRGGLHEGRTVVRPGRRGKKSYKKFKRITNRYKNYKKLQNNPLNADRRKKMYTLQRIAAKN